MFNKEKLADILDKYKQEYMSHWKNEKYKWIAVKHFHKYWDITAEDFPAMLEKAFEKSSNLLTSSNRFPLQMIHVFSEMNPETVRGMFMELFDENREYYERINTFKTKSDQLLNTWEERSKREGRAHYQDENAITTYLWFRYPENITSINTVK